MRRQFILIGRIVICIALLLTALAVVAEETANEVSKTSLVIPNLANEGIDLKSIYQASNALRREAAASEKYALVDHRPLFAKMQHNETRQELIELARETGAEMAVIGLIKRRRQVNYLKLELYNLKTDKLENKTNTAITTLQPNALSSICRGALKSLLTSVK